MITRSSAASLLAIALAACSTTDSGSVASASKTPPISSSPVTSSAVTSSAATSSTAEPELASFDSLLSDVQIDFDKFTLDNGLRVVVHEDRKAPVVAVSIWYDVGSKHEPAGKTGFAHLFEHLMFNGTENVPGEWFEYTRAMGATDVNGTTNPDRTNYFQTVPTGALDRMLMMESDRMGFMLGAVTQEKLDNQRGVVQNEKRQGDNQPYGLLLYEIFENLFPKGHPYHHAVIGSMADLEAASMDDVRNWFRDNYGPNNAVLVLAGDIDKATAKEKVEKWFGGIPAGPAVNHPKIAIPTLDADKDITTTDQIATTRIYRLWAVPGETDPQAVPLQLASSVLGGLASSRLDNELVRADPVAVSVASFYFGLEDAGVFGIQADVKPGVDPAEVGAKVDAQIAAYLESGPTADELQRARTQAMAGIIRGLESVGGFGGKAPTLASGELFSGDPGYFNRQLEQVAKATPEEVASTARKWLSRPVLRLAIEPGERTAGGENRGGAALPDDFGQAYYCKPGSCDTQTLNVARAVADRAQLPPIGGVEDLDFPDIERTTLSNGMQVFFAHRDSVPTVDVRMTFDAGYAADPQNALGTQAFMVALMDEGTTSLGSKDLSIAKERLGAFLRGFSDYDSTSIQLSALAPNLAPSLDLMADYVRNPAFDSGDMERIRAQLLNQVNASKRNPDAIADNVLRSRIYGDHPYGNPSSGLGDGSALPDLTPRDLRAFHRQWLRPDTAKVFVVGDTSLAEATQLLENSFGDWTSPSAPAMTKMLDAPLPPSTAGIVLVNRPNSPQSVVRAGRVLEANGTDDLLLLRSANEALGGGFLARINMNLREAKGWSYGARSSLGVGRDRVYFRMHAPVQADRTGDTIKELQRELTQFLSTNGVTQAELARIVEGNARELPGQFETTGSVLSGLYNIVRFERPDDYYETLASRYAALTTTELDAVARTNLSADDLVFVVVGDAEVVATQLEDIGLPVEQIDAD